MPQCTKYLTHAFALICFTTLVSAQTPPAGEPDVLLLNDGEKVIGHLEKATDSTVTFKSDALGSLSIDWSKVKELQSSRKFAAIPKNARLRGRQDATNVPVGVPKIEDQKLTLSQTTAPSAQQPLAVNNVGNLVNQAAFEEAFRQKSFLRGWKGGATGGISLTEGTQKNQSFTGAVNLVRTIPDVEWLDVRRRTLVNFNSIYSKLTEPGTPEIKTSLTHFDFEQDWYLKPRLFLWAGVALDHSFSQGLRLQQNYGAGVGYVLIKDARQELDLKAGVNYIHQRFENDTSNSLIGSVFGENYVRRFARGILFTEQANFIPSWNNSSAYTMLASAGLTVPVYHHFGFTIGTLDSFINNPPPGFKKNTFQFTLGATYSFQ